MQTKHSQRGVTLIESLAVLALTAIVTAAGAPGLRSLLDNRRLDGAATQLASDLKLVRSEAVARNRPVRISFHAACYVLHTGLAAQCTCAAPGPAVCSGGAFAIRTVHLPAADAVELQTNMGSMLFDPLHGTGTPTGTLRLLGRDGRAVHHVVNVMGRVRSCSPQGWVPGYRAC